MYAIDLKLPGMLNAAVKQCPGLRRQDRELRRGRRSRAGPGFRKVVRIDDSTLAVVSDTWWRAKTALDALPIVWDEGQHANASSSTIAAHLKEGLTAERRVRGHRRRRRAQSDRGRREESRSGLRDAFPVARDDGADELHGEVDRRQGGSSGCRARTRKRRWPRCRPRPGCRSNRCEVYNHTLGRRFRAPRRHAGLCALCRRRREGISRRAR